MPIDCIPPDDPILEEIRKSFAREKEFDLDYTSKEIVKGKIGDTIERAVQGRNPTDELVRQSQEISDLFKKRFDLEYIENARNKYLKQLDTESITSDIKKYFEKKQNLVKDPEQMKKTLDEFVVELNKTAELRSAERVLKDRASKMQQMKEANNGMTPKTKNGNTAPEFAKAESDFVNATRRALGLPYERATRLQKYHSASLLGIRSLTSTAIGDLPNYVIHQPIYKIESGNVLRDINELMPKDLRANMWDVVNEARTLYREYGIDTGRSQASRGSDRFEEDPAQYGEFLIQRTGRDELEVDGRIEQEKVKVSWVDDWMDAYSDKIFKFMGELDSMKSAGINRVMNMNLIPQRMRDSFGMEFDPKNRADWDATYEVLHSLANEPFITDRNANNTDLRGKTMDLIEEANKKYNANLSGRGSVQGSRFAMDLLQEAYDIKRVKGEEIRTITHQGRGTFSEANQQIRKKLDSIGEEMFSDYLTERQAKWLKLGSWFNPMITTASNIAQTALDSMVYGPVLRSMKAVLDEVKVPEERGVEFGRLNWGSLPRVLRKGKWSRMLVLQSALLGMTSLIDPEDYMGEYPVGDQREQELMRVRGMKPNHIKLGNVNVPIGYVLGPLEPQFKNIMELRQEYHQRGEGDAQLGWEMLWVAKELNSRPFTDPAGEGMRTVDRLMEIAPNIKLASLYQSWEDYKEQVDRQVEGDSPSFSEMLTIAGTGLLTRFVPNEFRDVGRALSTTESRRSHSASAALDSTLGLTWGEEFMGVDFMFGGASDARLDALGERLGNDREFTPQYLAEVTGEMVGFPQGEGTDDDPLINEITRLHVRAKQDVMPTPYIANIEDELPEIEIGDSSLREELQMKYGKEVRNAMLESIYNERHSYVPRGTNITLQDRTYDELPDWAKAKVLNNAEEKVKSKYVNDEGLKELRRMVEEKEEIEDYREQQKEKL